ncbi:MAG: glycosyltransferase family 39 protein [Patescibacteria group bacterium]|nr:glycosyltransferase family 39 protein [Patescibacteria group bacterium]MDE2014965.1 glycosyltransferase family 39 protein [Patescibacteria group bacterium]MDE2226394.1 glycosyltransferase family 39 protein [Patescibacteria group bacterium]
MQFLQKISSRTALYVLIIICVASFSLMLYASRGDSAIDDELAHIPAGYAYVHNLDYRLNPEHPPLVKALAMLPVLFLNPNFPAQSDTWIHETNKQWDMGTQFLYNSGNDANQIIQLGRFGPMLLTILLVILIYVWSREIFGEWWALLPAFIFAFSPTVLAHGHYVTTDVGAAFGTVLSTYFFIKFLLSPSRRHLFYAGLALGIAEVTKFSTVLLVPYFIIILIIYYFIGLARDWHQTETGKRLKRFSIRAWHYLKSLVIVFFIGYALIVYPIYFLFTFNYPIQKQVSDTESILNSFASGPTTAGEYCHGLRCLADLDVWMSKHESTRPLAEYMLGVLMVMQRSSGGNTHYFLGQVSADGSPIYFPIVYLLKEPLPVLIMVLLALTISCWNILKKMRGQAHLVATHLFNWLELNFTEFSMLTFIFIYWDYSIHSTLNIGFRHLLPTLPFIYILTAGFWKKWIMTINLPPTSSIWKNLGIKLRVLISSSFKYVFLILLVVWFFFETMAAAPYFLSYFNEIGGGVWGGYRYVTDSNYDWGQDLLRLQQFIKSHPEIDKIAVDYFGGGNPKYYLGNKEVDWQSSKGNPTDQGIHWLAVSINTLQGAIQPLAPEQARESQESYSWLNSLRHPTPGLGNVPEPDYRSGTSIFIYHLQ